VLTARLRVDDDRLGRCTVADDDRQTLEDRR
jgi:hypothetical protein